jgi:hydroxymethylglutaryl-CoA reductase (NADPH)
LRIRGQYARGDYWVPLATSEAALVASFDRGMSVITAAGGAHAMITDESVGRSPGFVFDNLDEAGRFAAWVKDNRDGIGRAGEETTRFGRFIDCKIAIEGNHVYLLMQYRTGDAAGQNMVTIATDAAVKWILAHTPVHPQRSYVEANFSSDKKASAQSLLGVRGKKVVAEVVLPQELVRTRLHTSPAEVEACARLGTMGAILSGTVGIQAQYANGLAALFIACGQDAACVAEAAIGTTRFELTAKGGLHISVTLPNVIVGTVGGGTQLPSQRACLDLLGLAGPGCAHAFAELAGCVCLAGEISLVSAVAAGDFVKAHMQFARRKET